MLLCDDAKMADLNEMLIFALVVERGSFSAAARVLGVPASTPSRKVSALEERLGARLLERTTRRLRLTEVGALYYERCREIGRLAESADSEVEGILETPRGLLRVAVPPAWSQAFLAAPVAEYTLRYPEVRVELIVGPPGKTLEPNIDLAIRVTSSVDDDDPTLMVRRLALTSLVPCASPTYLAERPPLHTLDDLKAHVIVGLGRVRAQFAWHLLDADGGPLPLPLEPRVQVNSAAVAHQLCRAGVGVALLPYFLVAADLRAGALVRVLPEVAARSLDVLVVFSEGARGVAKVRAFLDVLYEHVADG